MLRMSVLENEKINVGLRRTCNVETLRNNESFEGSLLEYMLVLPRDHITISCFACSNLRDKTNSLIFIYCLIPLFSLFFFSYFLTPDEWRDAKHYSLLYGVF